MGEYWLSDLSGKRFHGSPTEPVRGFDRITHDCPRCGKQASKARYLSWIVEECLKKGVAIFPCMSCNMHLTFPAEVFARGFLQDLNTKFHRPSDTPNEIQRRSLQQLLVKNWGEVFLAANMSGAERVKPIQWTEGPCPGCGEEESR